MNARNEQMAAILAADAPAAHDLAFEIAVLGRIEQRRHRRGQLRAFGIVLGVTVLLALLMPQLDLNGWNNALWQLGGNVPMTLSLLLAAFAAWHFRPSARI